MLFKYLCFLPSRNVYFPLLCIPGRICFVQQFQSPSGYSSYPCPSTHLLLVEQIFTCLLVAVRLLELGRAPHTQP